MPKECRVGETSKDLQERRVSATEKDANAAQVNSVVSLTAALDKLLSLDYDAEAERILASYSAQNVGETVPNKPSVAPR